MEVHPWVGWAIVGLMATVFVVVESQLIAAAMRDERQRWGTLGFTLAPALALASLIGLVGRALWGG